MLDEVRQAAQRLGLGEFCRQYDGFYLVVYGEATDDASIGFRTRVGELDLNRADAEPESVLAVKKAAGNPYADRISVGRARNCDLVLRHAAVSKLHAHLFLRGEQLQICDLGSQNGTWLNGRAVTAHVAEGLLPGDTISFGGVAARICDGADLYDLF